MYNPFDILLLFRTREFGNYWFETGTPTFLVETLLRHSASTVGLDRMAGRESLPSSSDVEHISMEALLFRTGYLTITGEEVRDGRPHYRLSAIRTSGCAGASAGSCWRPCCRRRHAGRRGAAAARTDGG